LAQLRKLPQQLLGVGAKYAFIINYFAWNTEFLICKQLLTLGSLYRVAIKDSNLGWE